MNQSAKAWCSLKDITYSSRYKLGIGKLASNKHVMKVNPYVVYVEGISDQSLFNELLDPEIFDVTSVAEIKESEGGKHYVLKYVREINQTNRNSCLGIVDRDYDDYAPNFSGYCENVWATDKSDSECMMLSTPAYEQMYSRWIDRQLGYGIDDCVRVYRILINITRPVGLLRLLNHKWKWGLRFKELEWEQYVDKELWKLREYDLIRHLVLNNTGGTEPQPLAMQELRRKKEANVWKNYREAVIGYEKIDDWLICQGHDVMEVLRLFFAKEKPASPAPLEESLRKSYAYYPEYFNQTRLAADLEKWKKENVMITRNFQHY